VAEQAKVAEQRLNIEVRQPAEAAAYAAVQKAQADRDTEKASVDVDVYRRQQTAEAARTAAVNEAESITALGNANAAATRAKGEAEAAAVKALAEAQNLLSREALASRAIDAMPEVARRMAEPLSNVDNISIISTDGASALTKSVAQNMTELPEVIKQATGLDLSALLAGIGGGLAAKSAATGSGAGVGTVSAGRPATATATPPSTDTESPVI
jgi:flotillin